MGRLRAFGSVFRRSASGVTFRRPVMGAIVVGSLVASSLLASCRRAVKDEQPGECTKVGQTCKLGPGLLGVCTEGAPGSCAKEPCLVCFGQH